MTMRKASKFFLGMLLSCSLVSARAQQDSVKLYQKAEQLLTTLNLPDVYATALNQSVEQSVGATPALANYRDDLRSFFNKYLSWPALKTEVARIYLKHYTTDEIDELIKFYQSPAGKKTTAISGKLQKEMQVLQQSTLDAHIGELNQFIANKTKS